MRGRPGLQKLLDKLTREVEALNKHLDGLPASIEADAIWKDIWLEETHHSTALEGNTLTPRELYNLVERDLVTGSKELRYYLEVQGYSQAARWVYDHAVESSRQKDCLVTLQHIRQIHNLLIGLVWRAHPPVSGDQPGQIRTGRTPVIRGSSLKLPPSGDVPDLLDQLLAKINGGPGDSHPVEWVAEIHARFEAIHPFADGNGRTGRLLMNYLLILYGYPPAIILKSQRSKYLRALERAQVKRPDYVMLTELIARAVRDTLNRLLLPHLSARDNLVPLSAAAEGTSYLPGYLRRLAQEGRLKAVKEGSLWLTSRQWLQEYIESRSSRGRRSKN